ncbi:hypothetical protein F4556_007599 [Kitasatospora gansuensis]|uniref:Uncharacterized protein n=1 Tax=Kitasatospora gansuensis TaxID=258050 RepID=A0A7W7WMA5_9ACTN|nr:hypothetical protein [Kitasatospora gansuensis]
MIGELICLLLLLGDAAVALYFIRVLGRRGGWNR